MAVHAPIEPPGDATNYLGGIGDTLQAKPEGPFLDHLGELGKVGLYVNDRRIHHVSYTWDPADDIGYTVRLWELPE